MFQRGVSDFESSRGISNKPQTSVYGKCILADYNNVHKDKCITEFLKLKDCFVVS
jgi:hypothetical protein